MTAVVIPIHKKDRNNPDNYRDIRLLNNGYKILSKIIALRLTVISDALLVEVQRKNNKRRLASYLYYMTLKISPETTSTGEFASNRLHY